MNHVVKGKIKEYYGGIARKVNTAPRKKSSCGCGTESSCCGDVSNNSRLYTKEYIDGLPEEAVNASLGCANPITYANLTIGETVLDLGSGGGIDVFIASKYVGSTGKVIGLDMTDDMLELANKNKDKMGIDHVEFIKGYIEEIPLKDESVNVILSNCVINLCEDKKVALAEAKRVLKPGGRLAIADIITLKEVPDAIKGNVQMWLGCFSGALSIDEYTTILTELGFHSIEIKPVNTYGKDLIKSYAASKGLQKELEEIDIDLVDGAFAGAYVKAFK